MDVQYNYDFILTEDDENINKPPTSAGCYSQAESQLSKGEKTLEDELDNNLLITEGIFTNI